jgi:hypothetical protein
MGRTGIVPVTIRQVSPSQIVTWRECQRKWAWRHIAKVVLPPHKSAQLGTETHTQLETYLGGGALDFSKQSAYIAGAALSFLPPPNTKGLELEKHFTFQSEGGYIYHGYMDVVGPDSSVFPNIPSPYVDGSVDLIPVVSDHKTSSNFIYAKTADDLRKDPQGVIYAMAAFDLYPTATRVDLIWHYMMTKGARKTKRVHLRVLKEEVLKEFVAIELSAAQIAATHQASPNPLSLPSTTTECGKYGGCPYRHLCTDLSAINPQGKTMPSSTQSMLDALTNKLPAAERPATSGLPDWANKGTTVPPTAPPPTDLFAGLLSSSVPSSSPPEIVSINPPGEAQPLSDLSARPEAPPVAEKVKRVRRTKAQIAADAEAAAATVSNAGGSPVEALQAAANALTDTYVKEPATIPAPVIRSTPVPAPAMPATWTLYVNCIPTKGAQDYVDANEIFAMAQAKIKADTGYDDYRLIDYKGAGVFAGVVNDLVDDMSEVSDIALDTTSPEGALALAGLSARATHIVRSFR